MKYFFLFLGWLMLCVAGSTYADAPKKVTATYEIYKSGIKIGQIEEVFNSDKEHYKIISTSRVTGLLEIFRPGKIVISSDGLVDANGLKPLVFSDIREGDEDRSRRAEFSWKTKKLTLIQKTQRTVVLLPIGTQDRLSAMYQFLFLPLKDVHELSFNMTNGSKIDIYNYTVSHDQSVTVPLGTFKALYVASVPEPDASRTEIWLAEEHANFPYKMVITERDGAKFTQLLTEFELVP